MAETDHTEEPDEGPLSGLRQWLRQLRGEPEQAQSLRDALVEMLGESDDEQPIDPHERTLIVNILKLHSLVASDIMVPRVDITALDIETPFAEAAKQMIEVGHSRVPVYRETLDDIVGMIHIKDLLPFAVDGRQAVLSEIARKPLFVAPTMPLLDLLLQMRLSRTHLALVVDEFGGTDGLVTIEDVIEEIVGEIEDEHDDADRPKLVARSDGTFLAPGRTPIEALEPYVDDAVVPDGFEEGVTTLGGLAVALAGHVPVRGEIVKHPRGFEFEVLDADPRRVKRLRVRGLTRKPGESPPAEHG
ncbi:MAG TPA: hemolysin family protein [Stellaceae bacterium]|jgi:CBS domain containing-hemolysin-like protein|nr:hemolysin family protein [Stellaceae bacterium]